MCFKFKDAIYGRQKAGARKDGKERVKIEPLPGTGFGAVVTNLDLANLDEATWKQIETAFYEYGVLVFPGQHLSEKAQASFARRFGQLIPIGPKTQGNQKRENYTITNQRRNGSLLKDEEEAWTSLLGNQSWHTDRTFMPVENQCSILSAIAVPSAGGGTGFADMQAAYDAFNEEMKEKLANMHAYHSAQYSQGVIGLFPGEARPASVNLSASQVQKGFLGDAQLRPLVKKHPVTGKMAFHAGRHAFGIPGMSPEESEKFLDELNAFATQPPRVYEHNWTVGDTILWDQRRIMHRARPYDPKEARILRGTGVLGEPATEGSVQDTPEAAQSGEVLAAELARLRKKGIVPGTHTPRAAL